MATQRTLVLASKSPRRIELLKNIGLDFDVAPAHIDESNLMHYESARTVMMLAEAKASKIAEQYPESIVIGSDTVVVFEGHILGQPEDEEHAMQMLMMLNGRQHHVLTGISLICRQSGQVYTDFVKSMVKFKENSIDEIKAYVQTAEPFDKAGAYAIQGEAAKLIEKYQGCYHNIVGLPVGRFKHMMEEYFQYSFPKQIQCQCR